MSPFPQTARGLYSASTDGTIRVWDHARGVQTRHILKGRFGINTLALDESSGWIAYGGVDGATRVLDLETGRELADFTLQRRPILAMAFDADAERLAVGDGEGFIKGDRQPGLDRAARLSRGAARAGLGACLLRRRAGHPCGAASTTPSTAGR